MSSEQALLAHWDLTDSQRRALATIARCNRVYRDGENGPVDAIGERLNANTVWALRKRKVLWYSPDDGTVTLHEPYVPLANYCLRVLETREYRFPSTPLADLSDERRGAKPWLPADDRDVTGGLVVPDGPWDGRPNCVRHGAMNRVDRYPDDEGALAYRCSMCGVGARWWPKNWMLT